MQAAAVRGIEAGYAIPVDPQHRADDTGNGATLGAMSVQNIRLQTLDLFVTLHERAKVGRTDGAVDRDSCEAERQIGANLVEELVFESAACGAVADNADLVTRLAVLDGKIAYMPENPADWRAETVNDAHFAVLGHVGQNRRSRT